MVETDEALIGHALVRHLLHEIRKEGSMTSHTIAHFAWSASAFERTVSIEPRGAETRYDPCIARWADDGGRCADLPVGHANRWTPASGNCRLSD